MATCRWLMLPWGHLGCQWIASMHNLLVLCQAISKYSSWQCDLWQPARILLAWCCDSAVSKLQIWEQLPFYLLFLPAEDTVSSQFCCPCSLSLSLFVRCWCGVSMEKAVFGQTLIILDKGTHPWLKKEKRRKKNNVELPPNGSDYNVMGLWAQS